MRRGWFAGLLILVSCSRTAVTLPAAVQAVVDVGEQNRWMTNGTDPWEVFVCHVPADAGSVAYAGLPLRLPLKPATVAAILDAKVSAYFDTLSNGAYHAHFAPAGEVTIAAADQPQACVDMAIAASSPNAHGVLVVADAEHNATQPGGFGNAGSPCIKAPCPASITRRSVYVGAADFGPQWGDQPPMDLVEHELGHALGWPHSGYDASQVEPHRSALDVMSNSAAPRDVNPERRDAPDTLAINRLSAGWLPLSAVRVVPPTGDTVTLSPSNGRAGTRLAVITLDDHRFITIELLVAEGFDDHLRNSGVAVHLIDGGDTTRTQTPLVGLAPYDDLVTPGETFTSNGWSIAIADGWRATIQPIGDVPTVSG
ncbi:MAG: hypothetical protein ABI949_11150 [Ilumatobacteraceae bacterium]